jgi:hypothetical protein
VADWTKLTEEIAAKSGVPLRPAAPESVFALERLGTPNEAITFFREFEPAECADIDGVRLWPIQEIVAENKEYVPGCYIIESGYIVFATTLFGDAFCFDMSSTTDEQRRPIVLISHDGYDWDAITSQEIAKFKKPIAPDFRAFLQAYVDEVLDIEPNYETQS